MDKVKFHDAAREEYVESYCWYFERGCHIAEAFEREVERALGWGLEQSGLTGVGCDVPGIPQALFRPTSCLGWITGSRARAREPVNNELYSNKN